MPPTPTCISAPCCYQIPRPPLQALYTDPLQYRCRFCHTVYSDGVIKKLFPEDGTVPQVPQSTPEAPVTHDYHLKLSDEAYLILRNALSDAVSSHKKGEQSDVAKVPVLEDAVRQLENAHFWAHSPE